ncbi:alcohol dehydrogenase catalytic domain-containing protein [Tropicimonas marinistellae]|uniref:alcohol dehydrogenase catalytic domain-containing protein n=1 Tax=Tropicimonas marinistellae TaxID=1739787 RepID=UPI00082BE3C9|nr:alcohol dehydrogenase catalytic domain-containing protein [Tropicimonas marinistellae]
MKAILFTGRNAATVADVPEPVAGPGEVLVNVRASGICHTDHDILIGNYGRDAFPVVPGHEFSGVVLAVGAGVTGFSEGDRVVIDPNLACETCRYCRAGMPNLCDQLGAYGVTVNGGFEPLVAVAASKLHAIGDLDFAVAALAEPMGCALNGIRATGLDNVTNALVFGAGPMGMLIAFGLKGQGIGDVTVVDVAERKLEMVQSMGFAALHADSDACKALRQSHDFVADATGLSKVAESMIAQVATGGKALFFSVYPQADRISLSPFEIFRRQIRIAGAHSLARADIPNAIDAIRAAGPAIEQVVSHRVDLDEALEKMTTMGGGDGRMKVQAVF